MSGIKLNADKICNICEQIDIYKDQFGTGTKRGGILLDEILSNIRKSGKNKKYDCVIGVSGGTDSSYLLMKAVDWGLKPLAVHYDNTWNTAIATQNIRKITQALEVDLYTHVVNNKEHDAIKLAYLKAGVQEFDTDTDLAFVQVLRSAAAKFGVKYILEGHSFM
jgi:tRNA(Ile)-lysidine synthase TilS/MesJ